MKKFKSRGGRLMALATKRYAEDRSAPEDREKMILRITARIYKLQAERRRLNRRSKEITAELRAIRRGLRVVLQRDEEIILAETSLQPEKPAAEAPRSRPIRQSDGSYIPDGFGSVKPEGEKP